MTCDRCDDCRKSGYRFCTSCGEPLDDCPSCSECRDRGFEFCTSCGRRLNTRSSRSPFDMIAMAATLVVTFLMAFELAMMVLGVGSVFSWSADAVESILVLVPWLTVAGHLSGLPLQLFWIAQFAVILASAFFLLKKSLPGLGKSLKTGDPGQSSSCPLLWLCALLCADLVLNLLITSMSGAIDIPEGLPSGTSPEALYSYANAAVWEEIICRVAYIGLPMAAIGLISGRREGWRYLFGGFGFSWLAVGLILISSVIFGFAHMSGWGVWKILPTLVSGLVMGYLFVRFGLYASIMFHFVVDYMGVIITVSPALVSIAFVVVLLLGVPCLLWAASRFRRSMPGIKAMPRLLPSQESSGDSLD